MKSQKTVMIINIRVSHLSHVEAKYFAKLRYLKSTKI